MTRLSLKIDVVAKYEFFDIKEKLEFENIILLSSQIKNKGIKLWIN